MTVINTNTGSLCARQAMTTNACGLAVDDVAVLAISSGLLASLRRDESFAMECDRQNHNRQ